MPGKVNPVVPEATLMACAQVIGNDVAITTAGAAGNFELNVMLPVMAKNILESIRLLAATSRLLADRCVDGITAEVEHARDARRGVPVDRHAPQPLHRLRGRGGGRQAGGQGAAHDPRRRHRAGPRRRRRSSPRQQLDEALDVLSMTRPASGRMTRRRLSRGTGWR